MKYVEELTKNPKKCEKLRDALDKHFKEKVVEVVAIKNTFFWRGITLLKIFIGEERYYIHVETFPGGCSWIVWKDLKGHFTKKLEIVKAIAKEMGYSHILISDNREENYEDIGFKLLLTNKNKHSGNTVYLYCLEVT
jgi:hypothetical protein